METKKTLIQMMNSEITPQMLINSGIINFEQFELYVNLIEPKSGYFIYKAPEQIHTEFYENIKKHIPLLPYEIHISFPDFDGDWELFEKNNATALLNERISFYAKFKDIEAVTFAYINAKYNNIGTELSRNEILEYALITFNSYIRQRYQEIEYYSYLPGIQSYYLSKKKEFDDRLTLLMTFLTNVKLINRRIFASAVLSAHLIFLDSPVKPTLAENRYSKQA